jgi:alkyl hydroperoxide reductase subunit AhpC
LDLQRLGHPVLSSEGFHIPMIGDRQLKVANLYDMLPAEGLLSADRQALGGDPQSTGSKART